MTPDAQVRLYPLLGLPAKQGQRLLNIECRLCGRRARAAFPWRGRPHGPQCQCNPNTWGNWKRLTDGQPKKGSAMADGATPAGLGLSD